MKISARHSLSATVVLVAAVLALYAASAFAQRKPPIDPNVAHKVAGAVGLGLAARQPVVTVPECRFAGDASHVDFSTTNGSWAATGPAQAGLGGPTAVMYGGWSANNGYWIQPFASSQVNGNALSGTYTYTLAFDLPCMPESYANLSITGTMAADNTFQANLNGHPVAACSSPNTCMTAATNVSTQPAWFRQGQNVLTVTVVNVPYSKNPVTGLMTGLGAKMTLNVQCGKACCKPLPQRR